MEMVSLVTLFLVFMAFFAYGGSAQSFYVLRILCATGSDEIRCARHQTAQKLNVSVNSNFISVANRVRNFRFTQCDVKPHDEGGKARKTPKT